MKRDVNREFRFDTSESKTLCMDVSSYRGNRETSVVPCGELSPMGRSEKADGPYSRHVRCRGVGRFHSTCEAGATRVRVPGRKVGGGVRGGKGIGQGKRHQMSLVPDTVPEMMGV